MKPSTITHLLPLAVACYSTLCSAVMLYWAGRPHRSPKGYQLGLLTYVAIFVLPTAFLIVPGSIELQQRAGLGALWAFLLTATLLGQLLPMFATHGLVAMYHPETWQRIVTLRREAYLKPAAETPGQRANARVTSGSL